MSGSGPLLCQGRWSGCKRPSKFLEVWVVYVYICVRLHVCIGVVCDLSAVTISACIPLAPGSRDRVYYIDDAMLGGNEADVCDDFKMIEREAAAVGLELNHVKSELICADQASWTCSFALGTPELCRVSPNTATLLRSPIGSSIDEALLDKVEALRKMKSLLSFLSSQDALILFHHSFTIPKILYNLQDSFSFLISVHGGFMMLNCAALVGHNYLPPVSTSTSRQNAWDLPHVQETYDQLLHGASECRSRAKLLAAATKESGAWLHALPVSFLVLRMDDHTTRIAVGLCLGTLLY